MSWNKEVEEIKKREELSLKQGGKRSIDNQHKKGRKTLRERLDIILDNNSFGSCDTFFYLIQVPFHP